MTEMSDEELRTALSRLDPAPAGIPVDPLTSPRARELVERTMQIPRTQQPQAQPSPTQDRAMPASGPAPEPVDEVAARRRRPWSLGIAAAVLLIALAGAFLLTPGGGVPGDAPSSEDPSTLALELPSPDIAGSCIVFDVEVLARTPVAFAGTVTALGADRVTLAVDRWYRGGDADLVTVAIPDGQSSAALDGVDFREGERYLVSATDGTVNGCGLSGPAEPGLEQAFEEAFGA